jgi:hypothetical protein
MVAKFAAFPRSNQDFSRLPMYLNRPLRTLAAVCRAIGRDDNGRACAQCALRDMCDRGSGDAAGTVRKGGGEVPSSPLPH